MSWTGWVCDRRSGHWRAVVTGETADEAHGGLLAATRAAGPESWRRLLTRDATPALALPPNAEEPQP